LEGDKKNKRAQRAASAFKALGSEARAAIPELAQLMTNPKGNFSVIRADEALENIGSDAWPTLEAARRNQRIFYVTKHFRTNQTPTTNTAILNKGGAQ